MYKEYYNACQVGLIKSCHDLSDGGLATAVAESSIGARLGAKLDIIGVGDKTDFLFNEAPGRFLVSVIREGQRAFEKHFADISFKYLGEVNETDQVLVAFEGEQVLSASMDKMLHAWKRGN